MSSSIIVGICGGSGSGKSWLARAIQDRLGHANVALVEQDWYYRDLSHLPEDQAAQTNFDHPDALELDLLESHLRALAAGQAIDAPQYAFARFSRLPQALRIEPRPVVVAEGLFILQRPTLRALFDTSVYVETPSDIRLIRRIRRDLSERGYDLQRILDFWERRAHPMHAQIVAPQRQRAALVWDSEQDRAFVPKFLADLENRLPRNADKPTAPR